MWEFLAFVGILILVIVLIVIASLINSFLNPKGDEDKKDVSVNKWK